MPKNGITSTSFFTGSSQFVGDAHITTLHSG